MNMQFREIAQTPSDAEQRDGQLERYLQSAITDAFDAFKDRAPEILARMIEDEASWRAGH